MLSAKAVKVVAGVAVPTVTSVAHVVALLSLLVAAVDAIQNDSSADDTADNLPAALTSSLASNSAFDLLLKFVLPVSGAMAISVWPPRSAVAREDKRRCEL